MNGPFGAGSQLACASVARRICLDIQRQSTAAVELKLRQHGRVDEIAIDGILHKELAGKVIHGERPEGVDWRELALGEVQRVFALAAVEGLTVSVFIEDGIQGFVAGVCADSHHRTRSAREEVVLKIFAGAEERFGLAAGGGATCVDGFLAVVDARP